MADIINLRRARKARSREIASVQAAANRAVHGRTKAAKTAEALALDRRERLLDGARLDADGGLSPDGEA